MLAETPMHEKQVFPTQQGTGFAQGKFQSHRQQHWEVQATPKAALLAIGISGFYTPVNIDR